MGIKGKLYGLVLLGVLMMPSLCFAGDIPQVAAGDPPSTEIFDTVLMTIMHLCTGTGPQSSGYAIGLFHHLIALDFVLAIIFGLLAFDGGSNFIGLFANKMIKYGFWMYVITRCLLIRLLVVLFELDCYQVQLEILCCILLGL